MTFALIGYIGLVPGFLLNEVSGLFVIANALSFSDDGLLAVSRGGLPT